MPIGQAASFWKRCYSRFSPEKSRFFGDFFKTGAKHKLWSEMGADSGKKVTKNLTFTIIYGLLLTITIKALEENNHMSYRALFSQLVLSTTLGFSGNAAIAGPLAMPSPVLNSTPNAALLILSTSQSSKSSAKDPLADAPQAVRALNQRMRTPENQPIINSCFREHAIVEKPVHQMTAPDAQTIVNCADKKNIQSFLANPRSNPAAIAGLVGYETGGATSERIDRFSHVANKVAQECKGSGQQSASAFAKCADKVNTDLKGVEFLSMIALLGTAGVALSAVARSRHRRQCGPHQNSI